MTLVNGWRASCAVVLCLLCPIGVRAGHDAVPHDGAHRGDAANRDNARPEVPPDPCFEPGTPPRIIAAFEAAMFPPFEDGGARFYTAGSWTAVGVAADLTWSFVPDGLFVPATASFDPSGGGPSELFANLDSQFASDRAKWIGLFEQAFDRWAQVTGNTYTRVTFNGNDWDDGAIWGAGGNNDRGDIRIAMRTIDGPGAVLAFNRYPLNSDMVIDADESWSSPGNNYRRLRDVIMHEHGHGLGLRHVCSNDSRQLMEPFLNILIDGPQHDDIRGGQRQYGDPFEPNDTAGSASDLGAFSITLPFSVGAVPAPVVEAGSILSLDEDGEEDWFVFSIDATRRISIDLTPIGQVYDNSTQNSDGTCNSDTPIDSSILANLNLQLLDATGVNVLATADTQPAGTAESIVDFGPTPAGDYYIRVYHGGSVAEPQLYDLVITIASELGLQPPQPVPGDVRKNRYVSFAPNNEDFVAFQVEMVASAYFPGSAGVLGWVGVPDANGVSRIVADRVDRTWNAPSIVVGDCEVTPVATYEIRAIAAGDSESDPGNFTAPLALETIRKPEPLDWADCTASFGFFCSTSLQCCDPNPDCPGATCPAGESCIQTWPPPDGTTNFNDVSAAIRTFQQTGVFPDTTWVDLHGAEGATGDAVFDPPNFIVNFADVQQIIKGFQGDAYPYSDPAGCP